MKRTPLVSLGQGDFRRDYHPEDLGMQPAPPDSLNLRFLIREPADVYHARSAEHLTSHALSEFRRSPLLFRKREMGLVADRDTTAYVIGRAAHTLILEGRERFSREYAVGGPINPKTDQPFGSQTRAFAEWAVQQSKPVLSDTHAALVEQMAAAVAGHPLGRELLRHGVAEGVVRCRNREHPCQARVDWVSYDASAGIVDLKTADDLDGFEFATRAFGYLHQLATTARWSPSPAVTRYRSTSLPSRSASRCAAASGESCRRCAAASPAPRSTRPPVPRSAPRPCSSPRMTC